MVYNNQMWIKSKNLSGLANMTKNLKNNKEFNIKIIYDKFNKKKAFNKVI